MNATVRPSANGAILLSLRRPLAERRKLAATLAADVVGFSRLISAGEDLTLALLRGCAATLIDPTIAVHNGCGVKRTRDRLSRRRGAGSPRLLSPSGDVA